jgi:hypothetical protein
MRRKFEALVSPSHQLEGKREFPVTSKDQLDVGFESFSSEWMNVPTDNTTTGRKRDYQLILPKNNRQKDFWLHRNHNTSAVVLGRY